MLGFKGRYFARAPKGRRLYLDHAGATPTRTEAQRAMVEAEKFSGNPGAIHSEGVAAAASLTLSRERIAAELACKSREIIFTSGLTESNGLAILGFAQARDRADKHLAGTHWIVSSIEHPSVLECFAELERLGAKISHIDPQPNGVIAVEAFARALRPETIFVSIGWGNSEIGTLQPLAEISRTIRVHEREHGVTVLLHSDAGQAPLYRAPNVHTLGVDLFSLGSGKLYGPRGIGALHVGKRATIASLVLGGGQERALRAGTEPVALAAGFAEALSCAGREREAETARLRTLRDEFATAIVQSIPNVVLNGDFSAQGRSASGGKHSLPHILNISLPNINSEYLILALDRAGLALSTKAACSEGNRNYSHVVAALGGEDWRRSNTVRFSLGQTTTSADMRRALRIFRRVLTGLPPSK